MSWYNELLKRQLDFRVALGKYISIVKAGLKIDPDKEHSKEECEILAKEPEILRELQDTLKGFVDYDLDSLDSLAENLDKAYRRGPEFFNFYTSRLYGIAWTAAMGEICFIKSMEEMEDC